MQRRILNRDRIANPLHLILQHQRLVFYLVVFQNYFIPRLFERHPRKEKSEQRDILELCHIGHLQQTDAIVQNFERQTISRQMRKATKRLTASSWNRPC